MVSLQNANFPKVIKLERTAERALPIAPYTELTNQLVGTDGNIH
ncbi:MAG: hypothetical protein WA919_20225 [Coleofasciculaceae cyanobacterium]